LYCVTLFETTLMRAPMPSRLLLVPSSCNSSQCPLPGLSFIQISAGAAKAVTDILPMYKGKFDGVAVRGPVPCGSMADIVMVLEKPATVEEVNNIFRKEAENSQYKGILGVAEDPLVSSDIIQDSRASVVELSMTQVVDGDLLKVMTWYDNEWGYTNQLIREAVRLVGG